MIRDYIINAGMLVAFTSIINQIFHNVGINIKSPLKVRLTAGFIFGLLSIILMEFAIRLPNNTLVDFRYIPVIMAGLASGFSGTALTIVMVVLARLLIFGWISSSLVAVPASIIIALISCFLAYTHLQAWKKWVIAVPSSLVIVCLTYSYQIKDPGLRFEILVSYSVSFLILSVFMYFYNNYLQKINESYQTCKVESKKDFLTGLNNVRSFDNLYNKALELTLLKQTPLALIYIDIDFFKKVNDTYGHKEGDTVLSVLGEILNNSTRSIDYVSRNGGEEFSIILTDCMPELAMEIAERTRKAVEAAPIVLSDGKVIKITISLGIACFPEPLKDLKVLREKADEALYEAKRSGRNRSVLAK